MRYLACLLLIALAADCGNSPGVGTACQQASQETSGPTFTGFPSIDDAVRDGIVDLARSDHPDLYTGLSMDGATIVVHRKPSPGSPLDAAIKKKYPHQAVAFDDTSHTEVELLKLRDRVLADDAYWAKRRINVVSVGLMPTRGVAYAEIQQPATDELEAAFRNRYGDGLVLEGCAGERRLL